MFETFAFLFGLILGSFLNVVIYRLPRGQSIVKPRSHCPQCGRFIPGYDNIPVLSFLWLRGRCRVCKKRISVQYPVVEIVTSVLSLMIYWKFGGGLPYLFYFLFLAAPLVAITFIDLEHKIIPDVLTLPGIGLGFLSALLLTGGPLTDSVLKSFWGFLAGGGALFLVSWTYEKLRHQEGIGGGDIKLAAMLGAFFGWKGAFLVLFFSSLLGSIAGLLLITLFRKGLKFAVPYGPFLAMGALLYLFCGEEIVRRYLEFTHNYI